MNESQQDQIELDENNRDCGYQGWPQFREPNDNFFWETMNSCNSGITKDNNFEVVSIIPPINYLIQVTGIDKAINCLLGGEVCSHLQPLALITFIRRQLSKYDIPPPVKHLLKDTLILKVCY